MNLSVVIVPATVVTAGVLVGAVTDLWKFKVYNLLTLPLLLSGLVYHGFVDGWPGMGASLIGAVFGFTLLLLFYVMGGMGGGDVKLMAAIGAWLGVPLTLRVFIASSIAAGIYALGLIIAHRRFRKTWVNLQILWYRLTAAGRHLSGEDHIEWEMNLAERRKNCIPFAAMTAIGLVGTLAWFLIGRDIP
jgi:prepilin peptidase CpaA